MFGFGKKKEESGTLCCSGNYEPKLMREAEAKKADGIKVLGGGCAKCHQLKANTESALRELGMKDAVELITDFTVIAAYGVMTTPALVIDGKVVSIGRVLNEKEAAEILRRERGQR